MKKVEIFTDGACKGNPGPGGYGAILRCEGRSREISGYEPGTTNNRMELMAAIAALKTLKEPCAVVLTSDSQYLANGIQTWIRQWKANGWRTAAKKPVKNRELWLELDASCAGHTIDWKWIKGHSGHAENERCDLLANMAIDSQGV